MSNDSIGKTFLVAALLCIVCSILVSTAAVRLKPLQEENKALFKKTNILKAAGILEDGANIDELFKSVEVKYIDLATGKFNESVDPNTFDEKTALTKPDLSIQIPPDADLAGIKRRVNTAEVFLVKKDDQIETIILPVYGKGLWSTMYAFLALAPDGKTIKGFSFYDHAETPGLGGEIDNPNWQAQFKGKKVFNDSGDLKIDILKGSVDLSKPEAVYQADGLAGATLTTNGVENMLRFWLGPDGFEKFLRTVQK